MEFPELSTKAKNVMKQYFEEKGYEILETDYDTGERVFPFIMREEADIIFVDVEDVIDEDTARMNMPGVADTILREYVLPIAATYLSNNITDSCYIRFDLAAVIPEKKGHSVLYKRGPSLFGQHMRDGEVIKRFEHFVFE